MEAVEVASFGISDNFILQSERKRERKGGQVLSQPSICSQELAEAAKKTPEKTGHRKRRSQPKT
jgi:hypothetical protein